MITLRGALLSALCVAAAGCSGHADIQPAERAEQSGGSSGSDPIAAGGSQPSAGSQAIDAAPYVPGPHGGLGQPCYPSATCDTGLTCQSDFRCARLDPGGAMPEGGSGAGPPDTSGVGAAPPYTAGTSGDAGRAPDAGADGGPSEGLGPLVASPSVCDGAGTRQLGSLLLDNFEGSGLTVNWQVVAGTPKALFPVPGGAAGSQQSAMVTAASSFIALGTPGGSGRGAVLNVGVDQSTNARCLDISQVTGVSFWARVDSESLPLEVVFIVPATQYAASTNKGFGDCLERCNDHPRTTVLLMSEWKQYFVPFRIKATDPGNARVAGLLQAIGWEAEFSGYPFQLDEIAFYR